MPLVSVIIPTHNRCKLLKNAIDSILKQTYNDFEIVVVDDSSDDDTEKYVKLYKDKRIKYVRNIISKGGSGARNVGIKHSKGNYIAFLDDDDEWKFNKLEEQMDVFNSSKDIGLVYTGTNVIYNELGLSYKSIPYKDGDLSEEIMLNNYIGTTSTVVIKKNILEKSGYFDEQMPALQDYDLWIRICQLCKIKFIDKPLVNYYNRGDLIQISNDTKKYAIALNKIKHKYNDKIQKLSKKEYIKREVENKILLANKSKRNSNPKLSRQYILEGIKLRPNFKLFMMFIMSYLNIKYSIQFKSLLSKIKIIS